MKRCSLNYLTANFFHDWRTFFPQKSDKARPRQDKLYEVVQLVSEDLENLEKWEEHIQALKCKVIAGLFKVVLS